MRLRSLLFIVALGTIVPKAAPAVPAPLKVQALSVTVTPSISLTPSLHTINWKLGRQIQVSKIVIAYRYDDHTGTVPPGLSIGATMPLLIRFGKANDTDQWRGKNMLGEVELSRKVPIVIQKGTFCTVHLMNVGNNDIVTLTPGLPHHIFYLRLTLYDGQGKEIANGITTYTLTK